MQKYVTAEECAIKVTDPGLKNIKADIMTES